MIMTKKWLHRLKSECHLEMNGAMEAYLLAEFEAEPFPHEWSEDDLYRLVHRILRDYKAGQLTVDIASPYDRLRGRYEDLQKHYIALACHARELSDILKVHGINPDQFEPSADEIPF